MGKVGKVGNVGRVGNVEKVGKVDKVKLVDKIQKLLEEKSTYTIIYEHNKRSQMLIHSKIWVSNPKILCSHMLVFNLNLDSRNYCVHRCWFSP